MKVTVVAGNPKPASRTLDAATSVAEKLTGETPDATVDVITLGSGLLGWGDAAVAEAVETVSSSDLVVCASPTFKATYTGVLKLFLDQFAGDTGLRGVTVVPLMLGAGPAHAMAPDLFLKRMGAAVMIRHAVCGHRHPASIASLKPAPIPFLKPMGAAINTQHVSMSTCGAMSICDGIRK